jgi:hypothetical protein
VDVINRAGKDHTTYIASTIMTLVAMEGVVTRRPIHLGIGSNIARKITSKVAPAATHR